MRFLVALLSLLACMGSNVSAQGSKPPLWPFHRTYTWPPNQGVVVVFHQYRVFGRTTRLSRGHESRPIRKKSYPYKVKKWWGWRTTQTFTLRNRAGRRLTSARYNYVSTEADHRIIVGRKLSKKNVQHWHIDSVGGTTPYPYKR
jgi:hypothetical protein